MLQYTLLDQRHISASESSTITIHLYEYNKERYKNHVMDAAALRRTRKVVLWMDSLTPLASSPLLPPGLCQPVHVQDVVTSAQQNGYRRTRRDYG